MKTLAIDCSTEACSIALFDGKALVGHDHRILGRGHAEQLVPMIAALPAKGRANCILVALGPGSFTGIRIGIATARALGLAWKAEVLGYPTLALVAAIAQEGAGAQPIDVAMNGGHGEWFVQPFDAAGLPVAEVQSLTPEAAAGFARAALVVGTQAEALAQLRGTGRGITRHPDARHALRLSGKLLTEQVQPIYGRAPDARPALAR
ncbi:tRNA (adenosine(37)-N6)-threonylcarbamoyltransferase complex dimerization subunit type 1 TsaB [Parerythrobacter aestuarii]|uniref:tRNA (adenosine(37)-N6)-threonylcarbamoyltransferase complex dimerization subunit type 1 TsaB n=1 Tax=Parerythrobacter aestuarii TaxID=3020909 RepID=UPI0024DEA3DC|nr:tRNA (adenosine(37)-N6)-threonylcarbamoyltransferase complex dimerization subunit type 1 TsaB [Parerythrobacter aestuarii]